MPSARFIRPTGISPAILLHYDFNISINDTSKNHTVAAQITGWPTINTTTFKMGTGSCYFAGNKAFSCGNVDLSQTTWSWSAWIYPTIQDAGICLAGGNAATNTGHLGIGANGGTHNLLFYAKYGVSTVFGTAVTLNQWNYCTVTKTGSTANLGVNGTVTNTTPGWTAAGSAACSIGAYANGNSYFTGYMDEVTFWNGYAIDGTIVPKRGLI